MKTRILLSLALVLVFLVSGPVSAFSSSPYYTRVLVDGAELFSPVLVRFSPAGEMYVTEAYAHQLIKMDPDTGEVLAVMGEAEGFDAAADIAFGPDGSIYGTRPFVGQVVRYYPDGTWKLLADVPGGIDPIVYSNERNKIYVSTLMGADALWEIDPEGVLPPRLITENLGGLNASAIGPDGYMYAPRWLSLSGEVIRINLDTGEQTVVANGLTTANSVRFDSQGRLHVFDSESSKIYRVDLATGLKTLVAEVPPMTDNFDFGPNDQIYFANLAYAFIGKIKPNGNFKAITEPGMAMPGSVVVRTDENGKDTITVAHLWALREFNGTSGKVMMEEIPGLTDPDMIALPHALTDDGTNYVISSWFVNAVQVWNPDTTSTVARYNDFAVPMNAIGFQGDLAVAELMTGRVVRASDRTPYMTGLAVPAGLATDGSDLYIGDYAMGMVWKAVEDGVTLASPVLVASGLSLPEGMTLDNQGNLLVVETGAGKLTSINLTTGVKTTLMSDLAVGAPASPGLPPIGFVLSGVAVSESGTIYVTADHANEIYTLEP